MSRPREGDRHRSQSSDQYVSPRESSENIGNEGEHEPRSLPTASYLNTRHGGAR